MFFYIRVGHSFLQIFSSINEIRAGIAIERDRVFTIRHRPSVFDRVVKELTVMGTCFFTRSFQCKFARVFTL